jgi:hypothetical protein
MCGNGRASRLETASASKTDECNSLEGSTPSPSAMEYNTGEVSVASPQETLVCEIEEKITDLLGQIKSI